MKKKPILIIIALFFPTIFNILFWSLCKEYNVSVWISYSFIHIAWLANIIVFIRGTDSSHDRSVTSYPGYIFSILYLAAELLMGIIFIIIAPDAFFITLTANLILFAVYPGNTSKKHHTSLRIFVCVQMIPKFIMNWTDCII